jgi:hypothetical protein
MLHKNFLNDLNYSEGSTNIHMSKRNMGCGTGIHTVEMELLNVRTNSAIERGKTFLD